MKKIIVLGIGNPYLKDDRIGPKVVEDLEMLFKGRENIIFEIFYSSGIELLDSILDYDCAIFVDSIISNEVGKINYLTLEEILNLPETSSPHSTNFSTMIKLGMKISPNRMPSKILFCAIGIKDPFTFSDEFSSDLEESYIKILEEIKDKINDSST
ncbi:MAG: hydrogenase 2 maturation endopeptidase [Candidatus Methanofastidiosum methylothiophilum]|uniref:Hydrogenase 2 maturation endopeptidase n=1 Tax=Candidatus Methanofastidiosum methylothiophilum TaxID=1705564 RepID=A0A150IQP6_9EURY|nr:MAG: hydrogenase 2 maturation endopeptidase [Candidatus Methanofastidiosum methylthiophilus]KYC47371.1 MAG: hydrogenase 2 maturation endopeptidase [Candidatus Methanofastidiosum methylthiophilus]KYC49864.1 MAG: hydrogenase 2 maturation endopeptidase [Candidatus Methanofastidiosum methylthiophilus]